MKSITLSNGIARKPLLAALCVMLAFGGMGAGCKKKDKASAKTASSATAGSAAASAGAAPSSTVARVAGPCGDLQVKVCAEAGQQSSLCTSASASYGMLPESACTAALKDFAHTQKKIKDERKVCEELVEKLCAGVGPDTETCKMVREKTQQFPTDRCTTMLAQSDAVIADLKRQEMANKPLTKEQQAAIAAADAPSFGPANAKVTVVEFSDFECPYCSRAANVTHQVREKYGDRVRVVFRQFPLSFHQNAQPSAEAALAAHAQGKFWEFHDKLFANQRQLDKASLETYAKDTGLDLAKFKESVEKKAFADAIKADMKMGESVAVQGTPTMFVNGERIANPTDFASVSQAIDKALGG